MKAMRKKRHQLCEEKCTPQTKSWLRLCVNRTFARCPLTEFEDGSQSVSDVDDNDALS